MNIAKVNSNRTQSQTTFGISPRQAQSLKALSVRIAKLPETDAALGGKITENRFIWGLPQIDVDPSKPRNFFIRQFNLLFDQREGLSHEWPRRNMAHSDLLAERINND